MTTSSLDQDKLNSLVGRVLDDMAGSYGALMGSLGHRLGLYKAMQGAGPISARELAARSECEERYVAEWRPGRLTDDLGPKWRDTPGGLKELEGVHHVVDSAERRQAGIWDGEHADVPASLHAAEDMRAPSALSLCRNVNASSRLG